MAFFALQGQSGQETIIFRDRRSGAGLQRNRAGAMGLSVERLFLMLGLSTIAKKVFGSSNDRKVKAAMKVALGANGLEDEFIALSDEQLRAKTDEFKGRVENGESLDALMPEAFAAVREAAKRALGLRPFDVQLLGGFILHDGKIAEMKTGEGKTLVATLPAYLNALTGKGVHVVTVNDYLAKRDAEWMAPVFEALGMSVASILAGMDDESRRAAYACDITYGTNNEMGFDYLRDNMKYSIEQMVQRGHNYAIVDEVDSILVDEARTPLIISGPAEDSSALYMAIDELIPRLSEEHYEVDEKTKTATLTEEGNEAIEQMVAEAGVLPEGTSLYDPANVSVVHHIGQGLRAHKLFLKDRDYMIQNDEVMLIDEFTGRAMTGRRLSEGLHQAIEAKEKVAIQPENQTLASITYQNYFRLYDRLSGMTGTALTEADEFMEIYGLDVVAIPTNVPIARVDEDDEVYRTAREKYEAIVDEIEKARTKGQPSLVGTTSIEKSELLAQILVDRGYRIKDYTNPDVFKPLYDGDDGTAAEKVFAVLNARYHEQEAQIVAQAGVPGAITIATNMAGRGTDIKLGGNAEMRVEHELGDMPEGPEREAREAEIVGQVEELRQKAMTAGGLYIVGTERHESRRIDNQLRGRSGRQGDPGRSKFYLSLEDDLMRIFGSERMDTMLRRLGLQDGESIIHPWVNKAIERAQGKVEARNFDIRKNVLKYDDVMNDQRKAIFEQRLEVMEAENVEETARDMRHALIDDLVAEHIPARSYAEQWNTEGLTQELGTVFGRGFPIAEWAEEEGVADEEIRERLYEMGDQVAAEKTEIIGEDRMRAAEKELILRAIDDEWRAHLLRMEHLRQVVGLRGYAQKDPLNEYKTEAFTMFDGLLTRLRGAVTQRLMRIDEAMENQRRQFLMMFLQSDEGRQAVEKAVVESGVNPGSGDAEVTVETPFGPATIRLTNQPNSEQGQGAA